MLVVRAPVRVSFAGGGTDLEAYYRRRPGMVVSATLDKYFYVFVSAIDDPIVQIVSSDYRALCRVGADRAPIWDSDMALPEAILRHFGVQAGYHLFLASEIPPGTGLGSSSAVAVAIVKALSTLTGRALTRAAVAETACHIEIDILGAPIGRQDQYAAAFGGLNAITFTPDGVAVEPLRISPDTRRALESNTLLFFTGSSRNAGVILAEQRHATESDPAVLARLDAIRGFADEMRAALEGGDLDRVGHLLHRSWEEKRRLSGSISSERIDHLYAVARRSGAIGGKITGAGGGGFLMLHCRDGAREAVTAALEEAGARPMDFHFDDGGARVLINNLTGSGAGSGVLVTNGRVRPTERAS